VIDGKERVANSRPLDLRLGARTLTTALQKAEQERDKLNAGHAATQKRLTDLERQLAKTAKEADDCPGKPLRGSTADQTTVLQPTTASSRRFCGLIYTARNEGVRGSNPRVGFLQPSRFSPPGCSRRGRLVSELVSAPGSQPMREQSFR